MLKKTRETPANRLRRTCVPRHTGWEALLYTFLVVEAWRKIIEYISPEGRQLSKVGTRNHKSTESPKS